MRAKFINEAVKHLTGRSDKEIKKAFNDIVKNIEQIEEGLDDDYTVYADEKNFTITAEQSWTRSEDDFDTDFDLEAKVVIDFKNGTVIGKGSMTNEDVSYPYGGQWSYDYEEKYHFYGLEIEDIILTINEAIEQVAGSLEYSGTGVDEARELMNGDEDEDDDEYDEDDEEDDEEDDR